MVTEIELKYSLLESKETATHAIIKETISNIFSEHILAFDYQEKRLSNSYFDTNELTLRQNRIALRTRGTKVSGEPENFEQTIKTSGTVIAGLHQRPEYNVDIDNAKPTLSLFPDSIWQAKTDLVQLQKQITELFSTNFTRHTWLVNIDNSQVEVAFDCGEVAREGHSTKPRIFEVELELVSGDTQALFVLTKLLFSQLALRPGQLTKAARGYALYHQSIAGANVVSTNVAEKNKEHQSDKNKAKAPTDKASPIIDLSKCIELNENLSKCIEYSLKHIQLSVDSYVIANSPSTKVQKLKTVCDFILLLQQVIYHFDDVATSDELTIAKDLCIIIESLTELSAQVQDDVTQSAPQCESKILALLHSENFNNLQLALLISLLKRTNADEK